VTHLYLIRHGEAVVNVEPIIGGMRGDRGLTPRGVAQAERLRDRLAATGEIEADVLIASTFPRARQTAEIIAPALNLPIIWDDEVQEMRPGEADGMTLDQFRERYGGPEFEQDPFRPLSPGGESWATFIFRCAEALERINRRYAGKRVVIVCHGGVIDNSFLYFFGVNPLPRPDIEFYTRNTSITHWEYFSRNNGPPRWRLRRYNDAAHLHDVPSIEPPDWRNVSTMQEEGEGGPAVPLPTEENGQ
jgi:probable phosphoglycerate mutase